MPRVDCTVYQIVLHTADLQKLGETERRLLLTVGHAANEISAFYRATFAAGREAHRDADAITHQIANSQTLLMLRMAVSKAKELFDILGREDYGKVIKRVFPEFNTTKKQIVICWKCILT